METRTIQTVPEPTLAVLTMGGNAIIFQILGVLLALFFIFLTVMNFKTWRWLHALTTFAVFCAVVTFAVYASLALKTRVAWISTADKLEKDWQAEDKKLADILTGESSNLESVQNSLTHIRNELARTIVDRGRVWRSGTPVANADGTVTVQMSVAAPPVAPADPAAPAPAPAPPKKHGIEANTIVQVFKEVANADGLLVPTFYLGEFQVTAVTEASVTMKPTLPRGPIQPNESDSTWMLYEVAPADSHEAFAFAEGLTPEQRLAEMVKILPPLYFGLDAANPQQMQAYATIVGPYVRHGLPAEASDLPDNTWMKVKFLKSHEIAVDAAATVSPVDDNPYDGEGKSQIARLQREENYGKETKLPVKFAPNDEATFDFKTANDLANAGIVQKLGPVYNRRLNDYEHAFHILYRRYQLLTDNAALLVRDTATLKSATDTANKNIMLVETDKGLLITDREKVKYEGTELKKYADVLAGRVRETRGELSRLYGSNKLLHAEIEAINARLTAEVERRQKEATAMAEQQK